VHGAVSRLCPLHLSLLQADRDTFSGRPPPPPLPPPPPSLPPPGECVRVSVLRGNTLSLAFTLCFVAAGPSRPWSRSVRCQLARPPVRPFRLFPPSVPIRPPVSLFHSVGVPWRLIGGVLSLRLSLSREQRGKTLAHATKGTQHILWLGVRCVSSPGPLPPTSALAGSPKPSRRATAGWACVSRHTLFFSPLNFERRNRSSACWLLNIHAHSSATFSRRWWSFSLVCRCFRNISIVASTFADFNHMPRSSMKSLD
jgi:hypothetical protein